MAAIITVRQLPPMESLRRRVSLLSRPSFYETFGPGDGAGVE